MKTLQDLTIQLMKEIPVSYYLDVDYKVELSMDAQTSYQNYKDSKIVVAFNNIKSAFENSKQDVNEDNVEQTIRALLYHEVSHAILTPDGLLEYANKYAMAHSVAYVSAQLFNIVEDARIEYLLRHYYLFTDFEKNVKNVLIQPTEDECKKNFVAYVFACLRFNYLNKKDEYIVKNNDVKTSISYKTSKYSLFSLIANILKDLYEEREALQEQQSDGSNAQQNDESDDEESNEEQEQEQSQTTEDFDEEEDDENDGSSDEEEQEQESEEDEQSANSDKVGEEEQEQESDELTEEEREAIKKIIANSIKEATREALRRDERNGEITEAEAIKKLYSLSKASNNVILQCSSVIARSGGLRVARTNARSGYNGALNTQAVLRDYQKPTQEYTYFTSKRNGSNNTTNNNGKTLNILLDNSGSYSDNDIATNDILKALERIEQVSAFKFNVYIFSDDIRATTSESRISSASIVSGGTSAFRSDYYNELIKKIVEDKTILLIDGEGQFSSNILKTLNKTNVSIISDYSNRKTFSHLKNAQVVYTNHYTEALEKEVIKAIKRLFTL